MNASQGTQNTQINGNSSRTPPSSQNIEQRILTRNVELLRRTLNELFHLLAARKLFLILFDNFLNRLLRCGDIEDGRNKESLSDNRRNARRTVFCEECDRSCFLSSSYHISPRTTAHMTHLHFYDKLSTKHKQTIYNSSVCFDQGQERTKIQKCS